jgi:predicted amidophosphoribosyltransferase
MRPHPAAPGGTWAAFAYDGPAGALVRALKFQGRAALADAMAAQLVANAPPGLLCGTVVPVPVHNEHRKRRGIDHAAALATAVAARAGLAYSDCLERVGDPLTQVGRGRVERMGGPHGAIRVRAGIEVPGSAVVVDDVLTTGATLVACFRALSESGCGRMTAVAFARTAAR